MSELQFSSVGNGRSRLLVRHLIKYDFTSFNWSNTSSGTLATAKAIAKTHNLPVQSATAHRSVHSRYASTCSPSSSFGSVNSHLN